jgi:branched-chain amino acid transport system substrate-binding protein
MWRVPLALAVVASAVALPGCLGDEDGDSEDHAVRGDSVVVYSSLPLGGATHRRAAAVAAGQRLALRDAGGRVGRRRVRLVQLSSVKPGERDWDPATVEDNAERAAGDPATIAYLGELDFGASTVSVPVTNDRRILQLAPEDGLTSLTLTPPGRPRAGPDRLYPSGERTFLRLVPNDLELATALADRIASEGRRRVAIVADTSVYGGELAAQVAARARRRGLAVVEVEDLRADDLEGVPGVVAKLAEARAESVVVTGVPAPATAPLLSALARRLPTAHVLGGAGLAADPVAAGRHPRVTVVEPVRPPWRYPRGARRVLDRIGPNTPADALYGYESMRLVLDALRVAGPDRAAVAAHARTAGRRDSPLLGRYSVQRSGDVTGQPLAAYRVRDGRLAPLDARARPLR